MHIYRLVHLIKSAGRSFIIKHDSGEVVSMNFSGLAFCSLKGFVHVELRAARINKREK